MAGEAIAGVISVATVAAVATMRYLMGKAILRVEEADEADDRGSALSTSALREMR